MMSEQEQKVDAWWIDEPRLLGSRNPTDLVLGELWHDGFTDIVSLLAEDEKLPGYSAASAKEMGYRWWNIPVIDYTAPTVAQLENFIEIVNKSASDARFIIHCHGGNGRTGTFAAAYWITLGLSAQAAIDHVRVVRPHAIETRAQEEILMRFEREVGLRAD